ncbi:AbiH family protein [Sedimentibacter sp.]|uniref:AbiH family protein n=1 Tax=Sedimentibacter sp. TaxID=1960295 RepID=UPI0028B04A81|nr:AbiH family protein [Sedimentibacter sp.]
MLIYYTQELSCETCGRTFIFRNYEKERFAQRGLEKPKHCSLCRKAAQELRKQEIERIESERWQQKKEEEKKIFDIRLNEWKVVAKDDIHPADGHVLYVIGNGFDLMHGVRSSYYAFRDSLGRNSALLHAFENFLTSEDIWADFEEALAHFDIKAMSNGFVVDSWLDILGAYDKDAGESEFYQAGEAAANPILTVVHELPRRFRMWIETLSIGTDDRPLQNMLCQNGKVLCFNYTEFVETLYGVSEDNICYIHGCRRKKKYCPKERLVLGHMPCEDTNKYDFDDISPAGPKNPFKLSMIDAAQDYAIQLIGESDEVLTKNCGDIISAQGTFFAGLNEIEDIITIGHSLSSVDWDYFFEIASRISSIKDVRWYFGCHGLRDLDNLEKLLVKLGIDQSSVSVFRTDDIAVTPLKDKRLTGTLKKLPVEKKLCTSSDGRWSVNTSALSLMIVNQESHAVDYETVFSSSVSDAFFVLSGKYMFAVIRGVDSGVFLFRIIDNHWRFINELESIQNQSLINRRLCCVFLTANEIIFVYNNRVRKYSLSDGSLVSNKALRNAPSYLYSGVDISQLFFKKLLK